MRIDRDIRLLDLVERIEADWPGVEVGWDLGLGPHPGEMADVVLEVFSLGRDEEREFLRQVLPHVEQVEHDLGLGIVIVCHDPEAATALYPDIHARIRALRSAVRTSRVALRVTERAKVIFTEAA